MTSVQHVEIFDVSGVRDNGIKALLLLAKSLGWSVVLKPHNPATIIAPDGAQRRLATDTSIKSGVFQSSLSAIIAHSEKFTPTIELIDHIVAIVKPNQDQERRLRLALGETPQQHRERMSAYDAGPSENIVVAEHIHFTDEQLLALEREQEAAEEVAETAVAASATPSEGTEEPYVVSERPARAITSGGWTYSSGIATERTWSDGRIDFTCNAPGCDFRHDRLLGVSGHWRWHVKRGDVEAVDTMVNHEARLDLRPPGSVPLAPRDPRSKRIDHASDKIRAIIEILDLDHSSEVNKMKAEVTKLREEVQRLRKENKQLIDDWDALQDLLGRKKR